ncbi:ACT domain-containing protein [uncultured Nocardioides sp.]|uniref:Uncharacterized protein n=1 Tax=uncultured Nocardioides sp. TaxID=198441 RepID=A0A6J4PGY4_9ACTN|nr:ACT domain-containing protein [uncultured Nocardioides sp.]CAA9414380.1 MAG: hypothetical protein AVDCRST_MAG06-3085 [uncultured Nocardioides sp.]
MKILRFPETLALVRLPSGGEVPEWAESSSIFSITATATETSLVCAGRSVPRKAVHQKPYTAFEVEGPLDLASTGVLVELLTPLAEAGISVLTVSTYDTQWILVPTPDAEQAGEEWRRRGHDVAPAQPVAPRRSQA